MTDRSDRKYILLHEKELKSLIDQLNEVYAPHRFFLNSKGLYLDGCLWVSRFQGGHVMHRGLQTTRQLPKLHKPITE